MDYGFIIAIVLVATALIWSIFIRPKVKDTLDLEVLDLIDFACSKGVAYAEQTYKSDPTVDRQQLALEFAFEIIEKANIIPENYFDIIKGIVEAEVLKLPKTHNEDGSLAI